MVNAGGRTAVWEGGGLTFWGRLSIALICSRCRRCNYPPIIIDGQQEYAMFKHLKWYPWVLPLHTYTTSEAMLAEVVEKIIEPAERKVEALKAT
jgi:hypothetical protein